MTYKTIMAHFGQKEVAERLSDLHNTPVHEQHFYYPYDQPVHWHTQMASPKHHHHHRGDSGKKNNAAMSALTLLAFLFFLNILQQCLREQMQNITNTPITVMTAREDFEQLAKMSESKKIDKSGQGALPKIISYTKNEKRSPELADHLKLNVKDRSDNENAGENAFTKIETMEIKPTISNYLKQKYMQPYRSTNATVFKEYVKNSN